MRPKLLLTALAAASLLAACGSSYSKSSSGTSGSGAGGSSKASGSGTVATASNPALGHTVLVNGSGMTLYHLSGEASGKFICTSSCLSIWHPLTVSTGAKPSGSVGSLSLVKRPEGTEQVAYRGMPLYTFAQDKSAGEANGQGVKDVGTWMAVVASSSTANGGSSAPSGPSSGSGGSVGY